MILGKYFDIEDANKKSVCIGKLTVHLIYVIIVKN